MQGKENKYMNQTKERNSKFQEKSFTGIQDSDSFPKSWTNLALNTFKAVDMGNLLQGHVIRSDTMLRPGPT